MHFFKKPVHGKEFWCSKYMSISVQRVLLHCLPLYNMSCVYEVSMLKAIKHVGPNV